MLYIRTDMNDKIATGHVMRCLSIAEAAAEAGEEVLFILADEQALGLIQNRKFRAVVLHTKWNHMETELNVLKRVIPSSRTDVLLIDSYMATAGYLTALSKWIKTAYIDDLGGEDGFIHYLICYANYYAKYCYPHRYKQTRLLLGPKYVPLRKSFQNMGKKKIRPQMEHVLLLSGGTDRFGILGKMLDRLYKESYRRIDVICGQYDGAYYHLRDVFGQYEGIHFHKAVTNMEDYMMQADVAVSAGGTTLYELCACGTPTISYSFADNQLDNVMQFQKDQLIDYAGDVRNTDIFEKTVTLLREYGAQYVLRCNRSEKMQKLVDGKGAARIAAQLFCG